MPFWASELAPRSPTRGVLIGPEFALGFSASNALPSGVRPLLVFYELLMPHGVRSHRRRTRMPGLHLRQSACRSQGNIQRFLLSPYWAALANSGTPRRDVGRRSVSASRTGFGAHSKRLRAKVGCLPRMIGRIVAFLDTSPGSPSWPASGIDSSGTDVIGVRWLNIRGRHWAIHMRRPTLPSGHEMRSERFPCLGVPGGRHRVQRGGSPPIAVIWARSRSIGTRICRFELIISHRANARYRACWDVISGDSVGRRNVNAPVASAVGRFQGQARASRSSVRTPPVARRRAADR